MFRWYVINTYSGHENKVKTNLEHRIMSMNQAPRFRRVVVPTEQVIETKEGQKVQTEKRVLPGYVLVNMDMTDEAWTVVKNTPGVTGFVGAGAKPVPLAQTEVDRILHTGRGGRAGGPPGSAASPAVMSARRARRCALVWRATSGSPGAPCACRTSGSTCAPRAGRACSASTSCSCSYAACTRCRRG